MNNKLFECALGFHEYTIPDKKIDWAKVFICTHCKKVGRLKNGHCGNVVYLLFDEILYDYDNKGNIIHSKDNNGFEQWYNKGKTVYQKNNNGKGRWLHKGKWTTKKPKDWEYELQKIRMCIRIS